jgi:biopolymer transport protein ExbD
MGKLAREANKEEYEFELPVSMIDVVFLLLIFFMVASRFKQDEYRLDANLPQNEGQNPVPAEEKPPEEMRIYLWVPKVPTTREVFIGLDDRPPRIAPQGNIGAGTSDDIAAFNELAATLKSGKAAIPTGEEFPIIIDARSKVKYQYVILAMDACRRAGIEKVKFQAPAVPGAGGSDWWHK